MESTPKPKPEHVKVSPEQLAVAELTAAAEEVFDAHGTAPQLREDGTSTRVLTAEPLYGSSITEKVAQDGAKTYSYMTFYQQVDDRGTYTWCWQKGGDTLDYTRNFEIKGISNQTVDLVGQPTEVKYIANSIRDIGRKLSEQKLPVRAPVPAKRLHRFLGWLGVDV